MSEHILIVDDESAIRDMVRLALELEGYRVSDASNAHQASTQLAAGDIDLVLLDWMMPGVAGIDFAARLRKNSATANLGIIMLTARDAEDDLIRGLDAGADDYICKPFATRELLSRIRAVTRRLQTVNHPDEVVSVGKITVDAAQHQILIDRQIVDFSPTEFRLLQFFATHPGRAFDRNQLLDQVWGAQVYVEDRTVDVHIRRVRKILEKFNCDNYITTVRGVGYRFAVPSTTA